MLISCVSNRIVLDFQFKLHAYKFFLQFIDCIAIHDMTVFIAKSIENRYFLDILLWHLETTTLDTHLDPL